MAQNYSIQLHGCCELCCSRADTFKMTFITFRKFLNDIGLKQCNLCVPTIVSDDSYLA